MNQRYCKAVKEEDLEIKSKLKLYEEREVWSRSIGQKIKGRKWEWHLEGHTINIYPSNEPEKQIAN